MEQVVMIEQAKADLPAIFEQIRNERSTVILTDAGKLPIKISLLGNELDDKKGKRLGGFLVGTNNTSAPIDFDRMNEDEIFALFSGEYDEYSH